MALGVPTSKKENMKLILNAAKCLKCGDVVVSTHHHDFRSCGCGKVAVDGGLDYIRRVGHLDLVEEHCAYTWDPKHSKPGEGAGKWLVWSPGGRTNPGVLFDHKGDAEQSARELAARVPPSDWYVGQLSHVPR